MQIIDPLETSDSSGAVHKYLFTFRSTDYQAKSLVAPPSVTFKTAGKRIYVEKRYLKKFFWTIAIYVKERLLSAENLFQNHETVPQCLYPADASSS